MNFLSNFWSEHRASYRTNRSMYVSAWPGLAPRHLFQAGGSKPLPFPLNAPHRTFSYVARNVIYHLFRNLKLRPGEVVLVPDYHSGVEVWAIQAAGASIQFYPINRHLEPDLEALEKLCTPAVRVLYVIHFFGWPQPIEKLMSLCRARGITLIEDCAVSLFSESQGKALGTSGDYAVFCLYKILPVPHGGLLIQNTNILESLEHLKQTPCSTVSLTGRSMELFLEWLRSRFGLLGQAASGLKRSLGRALTAVGVKRLPVGDISPKFNSIGFDIANLSTGMSPLCHRMLQGFDYQAIRQRRRENFLLLRDRLAGKVNILRADLPEGVCPLFFPILVRNKPAVVRALRDRGVGAVELWNYGHPEADAHASEDIRFLRERAVELPIHQDVSPAQVEYMADQILHLRALMQ